MSSKLPPWFLGAVASGGEVDGKTKSPGWFKEQLKNKEGTMPDVMPDPVSFDFSSKEVMTKAAEGDKDFLKRTSVRAGSRSAWAKPKVSWSYVGRDIEGDKWKGNSRAPGDASPEVLNYVKGTIVEVAKAKGLGLEDTAMILAIAHHESGFNPSAAAPTTSAHGVGQFINKTGEAYKLTDDNRWDVNAQVDALVSHYIDNKELAEKKGKEGMEWIYAYHHDGPSLAYGGHGIAKKHVMPRYKPYLKWLQTMKAGVGGSVK